MFFICTFNASKVNLFTFYLNGGLNAVSIGKTSQRVSYFWTVWFFLKTESEPNVGLPSIDDCWRMLQAGCLTDSVQTVICIGYTTVCTTTDSGIMYKFIS